MNTKISRPRILRAKNDRPLTLEEVKGCAPAVFQEQPWEGTSKSYAYIPTHAILEPLLKQGFEIHEVAQARPYKRDRDPYAKHMLRFRYPLPQRPKVGDVTPELVLVNAHDGTARYHLFAGIYRFVCSNGMVVGDTFASIVVAHRGGEETANRVIEGSYTIIENEMPAILDSVEKMRHVMLSLPQRTEFAQRALALRYPGTVPSITNAQLLNTRRSDDNALDLWTTLNVVQENAVQGGFHGTSGLLQRRSATRPIERVDALVNFNRRLWDAAMELV